MPTGRPRRILQGGMERIAWCLIVGMWLLTAEAGAAPPTLTHLFPAGGQRGSTVTITCKGEFTWPVEVWAPGVTVVRGKETGKFEIAIPADLAADRVWLRLYNAEGASDALPLLIGGLPEITETEPNDAAQQAQSLAGTDHNVTINGVLEKSGDVDGFAVQLKVGQTLLAAVDAHSRLGSPMDAILQVTSADGSVLAENHDDVGLDPRLAFTALKTGLYVVRLFAFPAEPDTTIAFRGGERYIYRLTLTTGPFITHTLPSTVWRDQPGAVAVKGWNIAPGAQLPVVPFGGSVLGDYQEFEPLDELHGAMESRLGFVYAADMAGSARVRLAPFAVMTDLASPGTDHPTLLTPPTAISGCIGAPKQSDAIQLPLDVGQQVVVNVESLGLDSPMVPVVRMFDPADSLAAETAERGPAKDAVLTYTATQRGLYRLLVGDRFHHGGDRFCYRLTVGLAQADFELAASVDAIVATPEKPAELEIIVTRHAGADGAIGAIQIEPMQLPPGVTAAAVVSQPDGPTAAKVKLTIATTGPAYSGPIRIRGMTEQPHRIERRLRTPPKFAACFEAIWLTAAAASATEPAPQ